MKRNMIHSADVIRIVRSSVEPPGLREPAESKREALGAAIAIWNAFLIMSAMVLIGLAAWWMWGWAGKLMGW